MTSETSPFGVTVYSKTFDKLGPSAAARELRVTPRHMAPGTASLVVDPDHPRVGDLAAPGARVVITYKGAFCLSGRITESAGDVQFTGLRTFTVMDDFNVLNELLGWPHPVAPITQQGQDDTTGHKGAYFEKTGPAETVVKTIVGANASRLGIALTMATDQARGASVTVSVRMHPTADRLLPALTAAGIGITVRQVGAGLVLDCYAQSTYPRPLTARSGIIQDGTWSRKAPTATRAVVGGGGEGVNRDFVIVTDASRETNLGTVIETFVDARDTGSTYYSAVATNAADIKNAADSNQSLIDATTKRDLRYLDWQNAASGDKASALATYQQAESDRVAADSRHTADVATAATSAALLPALLTAYQALMTSRGTDKLAETAAKASLSLTLSETAAFRYGSGGLVLGAQVPVEVSPGNVITDTITAAEMVYTAQDGLLVTPLIGEHTDDPTLPFARAIQVVSRTVRNLSGR